MERNNCLYIVNDNAPRKAIAVAKSNRLEISIRNDRDEPILVFWDYHRIVVSHVMDTLKADLPGYPVQSIHTADPVLKRTLEQKVHAANSGLRKWLKPAQMTALKLMAGLAIILSVIYFWLMPFLADRLAANMPKSYEIQFGEQLWNQLSPELDIDTEKSRQLYLFFETMEIPSDYPIQVSVVRGEEVNAFALPGGHIVVYDGLLEKLNSYPELAAVIAHEFSHVQHRHTTRSLARAYAGSLFISIIGGNARGMMGYLSSQVAGLQSLSYSRSLEKEADLEGAELLAERHIDLNGFINLFDVLETSLKTQRGAEPAEWISSHPDLEKRKTYIAENTLFKLQQPDKNAALQDLYYQLQKLNNR